MPFLSRHTRIGPIGLEERDGMLCRLSFQSCFSCHHEGVCRSSSVLEEAFFELEAWLEGDLRAFTVPLAPASTIFQQEVRQALMAVPRGTTSSYARIAHTLGRPGAARAVGSACASNPLPIFVPCHRILPSSGRIGHYQGGSGIKAWLLKLESPDSVVCDFW